MAALHMHENYVLLSYYMVLILIYHCTDTNGQNKTTDLPTNTTGFVVENNTVSVVENNTEFVVENITVSVVENNTVSVVQTNITVTLNVSVAQNITTTYPTTAQLATEENATSGVYQNQTVNDFVTGYLPTTNQPFNNPTTFTEETQEGTSTDTVTIDVGQTNGNAERYKFSYQNFYVIVFSIAGGVVILIVTVCTVFCVLKALKKRKKNKCVVSHSVLEQIQFQNPEHQVSMNFYQNNTLARNHFQAFGQSPQFSNRIFNVELPDRFLLDPPEESSSSVQQNHNRSDNMLGNKEDGSQGYEVLQERINRPYDTLTISKKSSFKTLVERIQQNFRGSKRVLPDQKITRKYDVDEDHDYDEPTDIKPHIHSRVPGDTKIKNRLSAL